MAHVNQKQKYIDADQMMIMIHFMIIVYILSIIILIHGSRVSQLFFVITSTIHIYKYL